MSDVLLLRLSAPWQSWGEDTRMSTRGTGMAPTKSGVIGMLCAAMGIGREDGDRAADGTTMPDLAALGFGVRIDQPGVREQDYQISARHIARDHGRKASMSGGHGEETPFLTERWYLADALFLAALEDDAGTGILQRIIDALDHPVWPLYMGRKSCPVTGVLDDDPVIGIREGTTIGDALRDEPWQAKAWWRERHHPRTLTVIMDDRSGAGVQSVRDSPLSFSKAYRRFGRRYVTTAAVPIDRDQDDGDGYMEFAKGAR